VAAVAASCLVACGVLPAAATGSDDIPVAGTFAFPGGNLPGEAPIHGAIHAVVRIPHGTAVFYSVGGPGIMTGVMPTSGLSTPYSPTDAWAVGVVDQKHLKYDLPMMSAADECLCSSTSDIDVSTTGLNVGWAILPPLPEDVSHVTVTFGYGGAVTDVPVTDRLPEPTVAKGAVTVGHGWPKLPSTANVPAEHRKAATLPLVTNTASKTATTHRGSDRESVALNTDVLFAVDKATLTDKANAALKKVAAQINQKGKGTVDIVGYTDRVGTDAHNQTLSQARAQSVLKALKPLVTASGVTLKASGRGEQDPVADNSTAAGRQLNRRVTVTFATGGK